MVGSIKSRIAAFEDLALKSKSSSQLMSILPPEEGFAASKNRSAIFGAGIKGKETSGYVPPPVKTERKQKLEIKNTGKDDTLSSLKSTNPSFSSAKQQPPSNREGEKLHDEAHDKERSENINGGPISMISVSSRDNKESIDDSHSISPLSFQGEKMPSVGTISIFLPEENNLDVIDEAASDNSSKGSDINDKLKENEFVETKGGESYDDASFDGKDENSFKKEIFSDTSNEGENDVSDEDLSPDANSGGPSINDQEEYDNFTLGSGESESASEERPLQSSETETHDVIELRNNKDDCGNYESDEGSDEKSFSDYVSNMRPIPSFSETEGRQDSEVDPYRKGNDYISGDEEDAELDDLSEKVDDDALNTGGRTVQKILDDFLDDYREIKENSMETGDYVANDSVLHKGNYVDDYITSNSPSIRIERTHSPIYYPEEDFKEEDGEDFDNETADDETGDLLGINFEELSIISDEKGINAVNFSNSGAYRPSPAKGLASENSVITNSIPVNSSNPRDVMRDETNMNYHRGVDSSRDSNGVEKNKYPLTLIKEEHSTGIDHLSTHNNFSEGSTPLYYEDSNRFSRESNNANEEMSQITESTYDATQKATKWKIKHPQDQRTYTYQSDQSFMTYSFNDSANSSIIMPRNAKMVPFLETEIL
jgi:hypothetical protein